MTARVSESTSSDFSLTLIQGQFAFNRQCIFKAYLPPEWQEKHSIVFIDSSNFESSGDKEGIKLMLCVQGLFIDSSKQLNEGRKDAIFDEWGIIETYFGYEGAVNNNKTRVKIKIRQEKEKNKAYMIKGIFGFCPPNRGICDIRISILLEARQGQEKFLETNPIELPYKTTRQTTQLHPINFLPINYKEPGFFIINSRGQFTLHTKWSFSVTFLPEWKERSVFLVNESNFETAKSVTSAISLIPRVYAVNDETQEEKSRDAIIKIGAVFDSYFKYEGHINRSNTGMAFKVEQDARNKTDIVSNIFNRSSLLLERHVGQFTLFLTLQAREGGKIIKETNREQIPVRFYEEKRKRVKKQKRPELEKRQKITG